MKATPVLQSLALSAWVLLDLVEFQRTFGLISGSKLSSTLLRLGTWFVPFHQAAGNISPSPSCGLWSAGCGWME